MNPLLVTLLGAAVRWVVTILAARGVFVSEDQTVEIISGIAALAMLGWSWWQKNRADKKLNKAEGWW